MLVQFRLIKKQFLLIDEYLKDERENFKSIKELGEFRLVNFKNYYIQFRIRH